MNRRVFLSLISRAAVVLAIAPEIALSAPSPAILAKAAEIGGVDLDEIDRLMVKYIVPKLVDNFMRDDPLLTYLKKGR